MRYTFFSDLASIHIVDHPSYRIQLVSEAHIYLVSSYQYHVIPISVFMGLICRSCQCSPRKKHECSE